MLACVSATQEGGHACMRQRDFGVLSQGQHAEVGHAEVGPETVLCDASV